MKIIDFEKRGNVVRFYLGNDDCNDYWGDDWDNVPYEHNAGIVYDQYIIDQAEVAIPLDCEVLEPADNLAYQGNSPYSKEDLKARKAPCLVVKRNTYGTYSNTLEKDDYPIYFGDNYFDVVEELHKRFFGAEIISMIRNIDGD